MKKAVLIAAIALMTAHASAAFAQVRQPAPRSLWSDLLPYLSEPRPVLPAMIVPDDRWARCGQYLAAFAPDADGHRLLYITYTRSDSQVSNLLVWRAYVADRVVPVYQPPTLQVSGDSLILRFSKEDRDEARCLDGGK